MLALCLLMGSLLAPTPFHKDVEFLGFSQNERATAWRVTHHVHAPEGGSDVFALVRLIEVTHNELLATFRDSPVRSFSVHGAPRVLPQAELVARHPSFAQAQPQRAWEHLRHTGRFSSIAQEFKDTVVRIAPDTDTVLSLKADKKVLEIEAHGGSPLGYTPICRLFEGEMVPLGHYRMERSDAAAPLHTALHAQLRVYYSHTGRLIAAHNTFMGGGQNVHEALVLVTNPDDPIGATGVGMLPMVEAQSRSLYNNFKKVHPEVLQTYKQFIGKFF
jgi:hypothetical protein